MEKRQLDIKYLTSSKFVDDCKAFISEWKSSADFVTVKTSGSTGNPKLIKLKKDALRASAHATGKYFNFVQGQTALLTLSPKFIAGKMMLVRAMEFEMSVIAIEPSANPLLKLPENTSLDFAAFVPMQIKSILDDPSSSKKLSEIRNVIIGGAPLSQSLASKLKDFANNFYQTFGMTETISHFALKKIGNDTSHYECLDGWEINTDNRSCLRLLPNKIIATPLITNDIVKLIDAKGFNWIGRWDNVINSGGIKLFPELLEEKIQPILQENRFYFTKMKDEKLGEKLILIIEGREDKFPDIYEQLSNKLDKYELPKRIIFQHSFDETATGKVKRMRF